MKKIRAVLTTLLCTALLTQICFAAEVSVSTGTNSSGGTSVEIGTTSTTGSVNISTGNSISIELRPWVNLTYKGGISAYQKLVASEIIFSVPVFNGLQVVDGYIVGVPYIPKTTNTDTSTGTGAGTGTSASASKPSTPEKPATTEKPKEEEKPKDEKPAELNTAETTAIKTAVTSTMKYAVSTREEAKVSSYVLSTQSTAASDFIKNRNTAILGLDANSLDKTGVEAIKKLMPNLVKADKLKVDSIVAVSATEAKVEVTLPVVSKFSTMEDTLRQKIGKDYDISKVSNVGPMLSNPIAAKGTLDKTVYENNLTFFQDYHKAVGILDLYTVHPGVFADGKMTLTVKKENGAWKVDQTTMVITATVDGQSTKITFLK